MKVILWLLGYWAVVVPIAVLIWKQENKRLNAAAKSGPEKKRLE